MRAIRIPVDGSGNPTGPPQEPPPGYLRITIPASATADASGNAATAAAAADGESLSEFDTITMGGLTDLLADVDGGASDSSSTMNRFMDYPDSVAPSERMAARKRGPSIQGSEGTADGSSHKSNQGSEQLVAEANAAANEDTATTSTVDEPDVSLIIDLAQFPEFSSTITNTFWGQMTQNSTTLDIIAVYLKGQKILYIDSKTHCENILNLLMMPTILISAISTVLSVALQTTPVGAILVACLTGGSTFILSVISFLKLDAKAQAHKTSAYQFDKLQTMCEFFSGKVLLIKDKDNEIHAKVQKFVNEVEKKVEEIKDTNQYIIPEGVRFRYPTIYSTNVFSQIKKMKTEDKALKNRLYFIVKDLDSLAVADPRRAQLLTDRNKLLQEIVEHHNDLFTVDKTFNDEINKYGDEQKKRHCYSICNWFKV
jgi:hypothetical protein